MNVDTRAAVMQQMADDARRAQRIFHAETSDVSGDTSFCGPLVRYHGCVPHGCVAERARMAGRQIDG